MSNNKKKIPALPYNNSSGWSGSSTSKRRANYLDTSGITAHSQLLIIKELKKKKGRGATVHELRSILKAHHGSRSGFLSDLNKAGYIVRLQERRRGPLKNDGLCHVYVLPEYVNNRAIDPPRKTVNKQTHLKALTRIKDLLDKSELEKARKLVNKEIAEWSPKKKKI